MLSGHLVRRPSKEDQHTHWLDDTPVNHHDTIILGTDDEALQILIVKCAEMLTGFNFCCSVL